MFYNLYKLSPKESGRRATEDFTTEILAGLLRAEPEFSIAFYELLGLPKESYVVHTQRAYKLVDRQDCIVDLVLESETMICFVELKVDSNEGLDQLDRYAEVLDRLNRTNDKRTFLKYGTKFPEQKDTQVHSFTQFTWHQIAGILKRFTRHYYLSNFYEYLKTHRMANNYEITAEKIDSARLMQDTLNTFDHFLTNSLGEFKNTFGNKNCRKVTLSMKGDNRLGYKIPDVARESEGYNEVMFSIDLDTGFLNVHLYFHKDWSNDKLFRNAESEGFVCSKTIYGLALHFTEELSRYIDNEDPSILIKEWYANAFSKLKNFMIRHNLLKTE